MYHIEQNQYIKAPASAVYQALTTQEGLAATWTQNLVVKPETGFINEFDFNDNYATKMKVVELQEDKRVYWDCIDSDPEWIGTSVSFDLAEQNSVTTVELRHLNWKEVTEFYRACNYNWGMFLYSLKSYVEEGEGLPYQKRKW